MYHKWAMEHRKMMKQKKNVENKNEETIFVVHLCTILYVWKQRNEISQQRGSAQASKARKWERTRKMHGVWEATAKRKLNSIMFELVMMAIQMMKNRKPSPPSPIHTHIYHRRKERALWMAKKQMYFSLNKRYCARANAENVGKHFAFS